MSIEVTVSGGGDLRRRPVDGVMLPTGRTLHSLWSWNPSGHPDVTGFPRPGDVRFWRLTVQPGEQREGDAGMHATATVDMGVVIAGEVILEVDGAGEQVLQVGDTFVQLGSRHRWQNRRTEDAVLVVALFGMSDPPAS